MDLNLRNETFLATDCAQVLQELMQSGAVDGSLEASNISCGNASTLLIPQRDRQGKINTKMTTLYHAV